ncbi:MAG: hypothetical protein ACOVO0_11715 [Burkholderiaceae bacterium]
MPDTPDLGLTIVRHHQPTDAVPERPTNLTRHSLLELPAWRRVGYATAVIALMWLMLLTSLAPA